jgi:ketosteroid isomerase-like protein
MMPMARDLDLEQANKDLIKAAFADWTAGGTETPYSLLAPDATWTNVGNSPVSGTFSTLQDFLENAIEPFEARMDSPLVPALRDLYADGDTVIALFDAAGVAKDGNPYQNTYTWYLRVQDGAIVKALAFFDTVEINDLWSRITP